MPISPRSRQYAITHGRSMTTTAATPRRRQAARSAATRAKVIAAARDILCAQGYSGATMHALRDATGISLVAIQHQFPTTAQTMDAVAAAFSAYPTRTYAEGNRTGQPPREAMEKQPDSTLNTATRNDKAR